jgi:hypothetical protein
VKHNVFAIELCLRLEQGSGLRAALRELVVWHPAASSPGQKWELLKRATQLLLDNQPLFEKGCWDFFDDDARARRDYDMWCNGMITEEGVRPEPSGRPGDDPGEPRFLTFTISLLLKAGARSVAELTKLCDIPEPDLWKKSTFARILHGLTCVSFAAVKSDVLYLIPGEDHWGLTAKDLEHDKFDYLRPIVS